MVRYFFSLTFWKYTFVKLKGEGTFKCIHVNVCDVVIVVLAYHVGLEHMDDWTKHYHLSKSFSPHTERSCGSLVFDTALQTSISSTQLLRRLDHFRLIFPHVAVCLVTCTELPDVPNAYLSEETERAQYQEGHVIHFTCEVGYISGPTIRYICTSGGWLGIHKGPCYCEWQVFLFYSLFFWVRVSNVNMTAAFDYIF